MTLNLPADGFGIYEGINTSQGQSVWGPRLQAIAAGGFKIVINYSLLHGHITDVIAYVNYAYSLGLKCAITLQDTRIWRDNTYAAAYPQIYADSGNASTGILFAQYVVNQVKTLPGVWGYYICDEGLSSDYSTFAPYATAIRSADSTHPRLIILSASDPTDSFSGGTALYVASCEIGGDDYYPIGRNGVGDVYYNFTTANVASNIQTYCNAHSISSAMVLQAQSWVNYGHPGAPYPTPDQMVQSHNDCLSNMVPRLIIWYSYFDVISNTAPSLQWEFLTSAIAGRTGLASFPATSRRGSTPSVSYVQAILSNSPLAYYRLNESTGTSVYDATSSGHSGTIHGGVTLGQPGPVPAPADTSMLFNGTNGYIALPTSVSGTGLSAITLECWFKFSTLTISAGFAGLMASGTSGTKSGYVLFFTGTGTPILDFVVGNGTTTGTAQYTPSLVVGTWYYVAATWNGTTLQIYINGQPVGTTATLTGTIASGGFSQAAIGAGSPNGSLFFPGNIGQAAIYTAALSASQILSHYNTGIERFLSTQAFFPATSRRES